MKRTGGGFGEGVCGGVSWGDSGGVRRSLWEVLRVRPQERRRSLQQWRMNLLLVGGARGGGPCGAGQRAEQGAEWNAYVVWGLV